MSANMDALTLMNGRDENTPEGRLDKLGARLKAARKTRNMTLRELSEGVGVTVSMLSKIENDQAEPSLRTLHRILAALDTSIIALFGEEQTRQPDVVSIMRGHERPSVQIGDRKGGAITLERLSPTFSDIMLDANIHVLNPGADSGGDIQHAGQEIGYVLQGQVELVVSGRSYLLGTGDSFYFASNLPHHYRNLHDGVSRILWVATPATF